MARFGHSIFVGALAFAASQASNAASKPASTPAPATPKLPLVVVRDAPLPGKSVRFDYQALDAAHGRLIVAHMNDASVVAVNLADTSVARVVSNVPLPRGVAVASEANRLFVTSSPHTLVILDAASLVELRRVRTGNAPDGVAWDPAHRIVGVSDQEDGAISLISDAGDGARHALKLGRETGNVAFDARRGWFWIAVEQARPPDELVAVEPLGPTRVRAIPLPGCAGAHGVSLHPDGATAFVACEDAAKLARVTLDAGATAPLAFATTGSGPDVLALDPGLGWLYVAAESGELGVFELARPGLVAVGRQKLAPGSHTLAVDAATHRVYFPLAHGPSGAPVLRVMLPTGLAP
jgi:DNA-binding beta-propeller fold protein YncE